MKNNKKLSRADLLTLQQQAQFLIPLTPIQLKEFRDLADGVYMWINDHRRQLGELPLYGPCETVGPTVADLEFVRQLVA
jgi:hypothetical protein